MNFIPIFLFLVSTLYGENFRLRETKSIQVGSYKELKISLLYANIEIIGTDSDKLDLIVNKDINIINEREAQSLLSNLKFEFIPGDGTIELKSYIDGPSSTLITTNDLLKSNNYKINLILKTPRMLNISTSVLKGTIDIANSLGKIKLSSMDGAINIANVKNAVFVKGVHGGIKTENISGDISAEVFDGEIITNNVSGNVILKNTKGQIKVNNVKGNVDVKSSTGNIVISSIDGNIRSDAIQGETQVLSARGSANIKSVNGSIDITQVSLKEGEQVNLTSVEGNIRAILSSNVAASLTAMTNSGVIKSEVDLRDLNGNLSVTNRNNLIGKLNFEKDGKRIIFVKTENGDITLKKTK